MSIISKDIETQIRENFYNVFNYEPEDEEILQALRFVWSFCAEIGETCAGSHKARAASEISELIDEESLEQTAENIAFYAKK